tara:strand:+ start:630 stop:815 length:186 start_codon:yes stop_codon:yes gene_type:complete
MGETFTEKSANACAYEGITLTEDEELQISEMECEGLTPDQAPVFIRNIRKRKLKQTTHPIS